ncbi:MAG: signal transduction histidine kinase/CheY-like chemotaxis protein, partial [Planctomycetota bacterium]
LMNGNDTSLTVYRPDGESIEVRIQAREFELDGRPVVHTLWRKPTDLEDRSAEQVDASDSEFTLIQGSDFETQNKADLQALLAETYPLTGKPFFDTLTQRLAQLLKLKFVAIARFADSSDSSLEFISYYGNGKHRNEFPIAVESTPESEVLATGELSVSSKLQTIFPFDLKSKKLGLTAFVGIALCDPDGEAIGTLSAYHTKELGDANRVIEVLRHFGERAAIELDRLSREERIRELLATRAVLIDLLLSTLSPSSISEKLDESIRMICSVRITSIPHAGALYLHDERTSELCLVSNQRLDPHELGECDRSANNWFRERKSQAERTGVDSELQSSQSSFIRSDSFFLIPIQAQSVTFGLLVLQRVAGRDESSTERYFFQAAASILAGMLDRERSKGALANAESRVLRSQRLEAVGQLAGGIAHDFNNLLTAILGNVELLTERIPSSPELSSIQRAGESAGRLTAQLLAFTRRQVLKPQRLDVGVAVRDVAQMLERIIPESITLKITAAPSQFYTVADAGQLQQVLMNLFINARDAMPSGGLLGVETKLVTFDQIVNEIAIPPGTYVQISVTDSGVGIDGHSLQRIYEPFYTTKIPTRTANTEGTGLGLSVVYGIVKQHGGYIDVQSEPGRGTEFRIFLVADAAPQDVSTIEQPPLATSIEGTASILIIEDQEDVRDIAARLLGSLGYDVQTATGGPEALAMFSDPDFCVDLVLLDVVMPVMSGIETFGKLRKLRNGQKVVFMTGHDPTASLKNVLSSDGAALLHKPFTRHQLGETIRTLLIRDESTRRL